LDHTDPTGLAGDDQVVVLVVVAVAAGTHPPIDPGGGTEGWTAVRGRRGVIEPVRVIEPGPRPLWMDKVSEPGGHTGCQARHPLVLPFDWPFRPFGASGAPFGGHSYVCE
jgi:hypothetical protein